MERIEILFNQNSKFKRFKINILKKFFEYYWCDDSIRILILKISNFYFY